MINTRIILPLLALSLVWTNGCAPWRRPASTATGPIQASPYAETSPLPSTSLQLVRDTPPHRKPILEFLRPDHSQSDRDFNPPIDQHNHVAHHPTAGIYGENEEWNAARNDQPLRSVTWDVNQVLTQPPATFWDRVVEDHRNYYSPRNLAGLGVAFGVGASMANTQFDLEVYQHFNSSIVNAPTDEWSEAFHSPKEFGNGLYTLPLFAAAWGIGELCDDSAIGGFAAEWGERSLRSFLVGAPPVILMQKVTGGSRPIEGDSNWDFWVDNNGVSGHAFAGALPFLTAAQIVDDPFAKLLLYGASTAVPISRLNDGAHYPSQIFLGWCMAWSAAMAVDATQDGDSQWRTMPFLYRDYSGVAFEFRW